MWSPALPHRAPRCIDCRTSTVIAVAAVIGQPVNQHPTVTDRTIRREVVRGHEPSLGLDDYEGSTGLVRGDSPMSAIGTDLLCAPACEQSAVGGGPVLLWRRRGSSGWPHADNAHSKPRSFS